MNEYIRCELPCFEHIHPAYIAEKIEEGKIYFWEENEDTLKKFISKENFNLLYANTCATSIKKIYEKGTIISDNERFNLLQELGTQFNEFTTKLESKLNTTPVNTRIKKNLSKYKENCSDTAYPSIAIDSGFLGSELVYKCKEYYEKKFPKNDASTLAIALLKDVTEHYTNNGVKSPINTCFAIYKEKENESYPTNNEENLNNAALKKQNSKESWAFPPIYTLPFVKLGETFNFSYSLYEEPLNNNSCITNTTKTTVNINTGYTGVCIKAIAENSISANIEEALPNNCSFTQNNYFFNKESNTAFVCVTVNIADLSVFRFSVSNFEGKKLFSVLLAPKDA